MRICNVCATEARQQSTARRCATWCMSRWPMKQIKEYLQRTMKDEMVGLNLQTQSLISGLNDPIKMSLYIFYFSFTICPCSSWILFRVQSSEHKPVWSSEYKHEIQSFWSWRYSIYGGTQINLHLPLTGPGELQKVQKQGFTLDILLRSWQTSSTYSFWLKKGTSRWSNWCQAQLQEISKQCCKQFIPYLPRNWLSDTNSILETSSTDKKFVNEQIGKHSELLSNSSLTKLTWHKELKKNMMSTGNWEQYAGTDMASHARYHKEIQI